VIDAYYFITKITNYQTALYKKRNSVFLAFGCLPLAFGCWLLRKLIA